MAYWLLKSEPDVFGWDHLTACENQQEPWDGIRNYQARNFIRDDMKDGDLAFFYHSNTEIPGIVGIAKIVGDARPDHTQFDPESKYYDPKSTADKPRWLLRDVQAVRPLQRKISLAELKEHATGALAEFRLVQRGNRLSIIPVEKDQWDFVLSLEAQEP